MNSGLAVSYEVVTHDRAGRERVHPYAAEDALAPARLCCSSLSRLPGPDPMTTLLEVLPMWALFGGSIWLAVLFERR